LQSRFNVSRRANYWLLTAAIVAAGAISSRWWLNPQAQRPRIIELEPQNPRVRPKDPQSGTNVDDEVARLRGELKRKDELVRTLIAASAARASASEAAEQQVTGSAASPGAELPAPVQPTDLLDERLLTAPKDPRLTAELDGALRESLNHLSFGDAKIASLECAASLCKVVFSANTPNGSGSAADSTTGKLPKVFASTVSYRLDDQRTAMYLGRSSADVEVSVE
jgi:hypothetical protein